MTENIHATGLILAETGLILRGPSGAGKSLLALTLLDHFESRGRPAFLVSDDRIEIDNIGGGLEMRAPKAIEGLIELRGRGIVHRPFRPASPLHLVVDLVDRYERMVEESELVTSLLGVAVARCPVPRLGLVDLTHQGLLIREAISAL